MTAQIPSQALGLAIGVLVYSFACLSLGLLTVWLVWIHRERQSYVFLLAVFTSLGTVASITQQIHTVVWWRDIKIEQYRYAVKHVGNPELAIAGASYGLDLALFYIQFTCYNIESFLIFFWCAALLRSIFQLQSFRRVPKYASFLVKSLAVVIPIMLVSLLQSPSVQHDTLVFLLLANGCMAIGLTASAVMLFVILGRYIYTRQQFLSWHVPYGKSSQESASVNINSSTASLQPRHSIYDRWLLVRFTIGFIALGIFQILVILFEIQSANHNTLENLGSSPNLSLTRVRSDFLFFMPGASPPLVVFVVFGTTTPFREYLYTRCVPRKLKSRRKSMRFSFVNRRHVANPNQQELGIYPMSDDWASSSQPSLRVVPTSTCGDEEPILGNSVKKE